MKIDEHFEYSVHESKRSVTCWVAPTLKHKEASVPVRNVCHRNVDHVLAGSLNWALCFKSFITLLSAVA